MPDKKETNAIAVKDQIVSQVFDLGNGFNIEVPDDIEEIKHRLIKAEVTNVLSAVEAGVYYSHLKNTLKHGEYVSFLKELNVPRQRAHDQIRVAKLFKKLNVRSNGHLDKNCDFNLTQLVELTRLPEKQLEELESLRLEEFSKMPVKQLRLAIKEICLEHDEENKLKAENNNLKRQNKQLELERAEAINEANHERLKKAPETLFGLPYLLAEIKSDAPALSEELSHVVVKMAHMVEQLTNGLTDTKQAAQAAGALATFMNGPFLHLHYALKKLCDHYPEETASDHFNLPDYSEAHWEEAHNRRRHVIDQHDLQNKYISQSTVRKNAKKGKA